jgi:hypothetical protein
MELVPGVPLTQYCDENRLNTRERLELFVPVCEAVQHAHQKGVIHRDLKPSNVLVTMYDGRPVPKVIDFGVAKAVGQRLTEKTLYTRLAQVVGTPLYMSPEQAELSGQDVDTRADIYALGVLLYELLTGTTPFDTERLRSAPFDEMRRIIREEEPARPSTRISTLGMAATTASANRGSDPRRVSELLRGELDWIVLKALEKDRNRRYETATAVAADVGRYLRDEPVLAFPPAASYRLRKFARRYRAILAAVSMTLSALVAGTAVATWQAVQATRAAAAHERGRAEDNLALALKALDETYLQVVEDRFPRDPQRADEDRRLLEKALAFYEQFIRQNGEAPAARAKSAAAHGRVASVRAKLGRHDEAERDDELERVAGGEFHAPQPISTREIVVAIPDAPENGVWSRGPILERQFDRLGCWQHFAEGTGHVPAAAELVEQRVNGVAGGEIGRAGQPHAALGHGDTKALIVGVGFVRLAEPLDRQLADGDRETLVVGTGRAGHDLGFSASDSLQYCGQVADRFAQPAAVIFRLKRSPYGSRLGIRRWIVEQSRAQRWRRGRGHPEYSSPGRRP